MVELSDSFESVDSDIEEEELLLPSSASSLTEAPPPGPPPPPTREEPLPPAKQATLPEAAPWEDPPQATDTNTTTTTTTSTTSTLSVSDKPKDLEAIPEAKPEPPPPPSSPPPSSPHAAAAAAGGAKHWTHGHCQQATTAAKRFTIFVRVGAMMIGFVVAEIPGAVIMYVVSDALLRLLQRQSAQSQSQSFEENAGPGDPHAS